MHLHQSLGSCQGFRGLFLCLLALVLRMMFTLLLDTEREKERERGKRVDVSIFLLGHLNGYIPAGLADDPKPLKVAPYMISLIPRKQREWMLITRYQDMSPD